MISLLYSQCDELKWRADHPVRTVLKRLMDAVGPEFCARRLPVIDRRAVRRNEKRSAAEAEDELKLWRSIPVAKL